MAERLACDLAARGLVIFSGLARGVDTAGHRGAIVARGKTVAVFGTGVDEIYPKQNARLVEQLLALGGAVISEFPLSTFPAPQNFPIRNRIVAGISDAVVVIETRPRGGSMLTVDNALTYHRKVFAVPGRLDDERSAGANPATIAVNNDVASVNARTGPSSLMIERPPQGPSELKAASPTTHPASWFGLSPGSRW